MAGATVPSPTEYMSVVIHASIILRYFSIAIICINLTDGLVNILSKNRPRRTDIAVCRHSFQPVIPKTLTLLSKNCWSHTSSADVVIIVDKRTLSLSCTISIAPIDGAPGPRVFHAYVDNGVARVPNNTYTYLIRLGASGRSQAPSPVAEPFQQYQS